MVCCGPSLFAWSNYLVKSICPCTCRPIDTPSRASSNRRRCTNLYKGPHYVVSVGIFLRRERQYGVHLFLWVSMEYILYTETILPNTNSKNKLWSHNEQHHQNAGTIGFAIQVHQLQDLKKKLFNMQHVIVFFWLILKIGRAYLLFPPTYAQGINSW